MHMQQAQIEAELDKAMDTLVEVCAADKKPTTESKILAIVAVGVLLIAHTLVARLPPRLA